jgi:flagellar biosynthesis/type III secretory pathway protein FliH
MMTTRALRLEDFGGSIQPAHRREVAEAVAIAAEKARAEGYADGFLDATETAEAEDRAAVAQLREAMLDMELSMTAARADAIAALRPVVAALAHVVAPVAAAAAFETALAEAVESRLRAAVDRKLRILASPERVEGLRVRFGDAVEVVAEPAMTGATARIEWSGGGAAFDVEGCLTAARSMVERFFGETGDRSDDVH